MQPLCRTKEYRARLTRAVAYGNDVIEVLPGELVDGFRAMPGNVNAELVHDSDRFRPHHAGPGARTLHFEAVPRVVPEQTFRHLAAGGISGAENEHAFLSVHILASD